MCETRRTFYIHAGIQRLPLHAVLRARQIDCVECLVADRETDNNSERTEDQQVGGEEEEGPITSQHDPRLIRRTLTAVVYGLRL